MEWRLLWRVTSATRRGVQLLVTPSHYTCRGIYQVTLLWVVWEAAALLACSEALAMDIALRVKPVDLRRVSDLQLGTA